VGNYVCQGCEVPCIGVYRLNVRDSYARNWICDHCKKAKPSRKVTGTPMGGSRRGIAAARGVVGSPGKGVCWLDDSVPFLTDGAGAGGSPGMPISEAVTAQPKGRRNRTVRDW
jgi:hypothetical protein